MFMLKTIKYIPYVVCIILIFLLVRSCEKEVEEKDDGREAEHLAKIAHQESIIARQDTVIKQIQVKFKADSTKQERRLFSSLQTVSKLSTRIVELKQDRLNSGVSVDTVTILIETKYDSIVSVQAKEISSLRTDKVNMWESWHNEVSATKQKWLAQIVISDEWQTSSEEQKRLLKREKRKGTVLKVGLAILAGVVVYQEIKD